MTQAREDNRAAFPFAASVVDELRAVFGDGVKLIYAAENGREIGKEDKTPGVVPVRVATVESINLKNKGKA